jgi:hypothetical protein
MIFDRDDELGLDALGELAPLVPGGQTQ